MNNNGLNSLAVYAAQLQVAFVRAFKRDKGLTAFLLSLCWLLLPFLFQTLLHPGDMIVAEYSLQGLRVPQLVTPHQWYFAITVTLFLLAVLALCQFCCTTLFYRHALLTAPRAATPQLWPLAALLTGVAGNAAWFVGLGVIDPSGIVIGFISTGLAIVAEIIVDALGHDFVLGSRASNIHPQMRNQTSW